jgi:DNA adenine methylase
MSITPPVTYYGGKTSMIKYLLPLIPKHTLYCEPFFGGGALYFAKEASTVEVINDNNRQVVNFFEQLKLNPKPLKRLINATLHSRQQYKEAKLMNQHPHLFSAIQCAWAFWILTNQGFSNMIGAWAFSKTKSVRGIKKKRLDYSLISKRLERTQIECCEALKVIKNRDSKESFFYIDPPYIGADQGHYKGYDEKDFEELLKLLSNIKGKFLLSNYSCMILKKYAKENGWFIKKIKMNGSNKSKRKTEVLVANYKI